MNLIGKFYNRSVKFIVNSQEFIYECNLTISDEPDAEVYKNWAGEHRVNVNYVHLSFTLSNVNLQMVGEQNPDADLTEILNAKNSGTVVNFYPLHDALPDFSLNCVIIPEGTTFVNVNDMFIERPVRLQLKTEEPLSNKEIPEELKLTNATPNFVINPYSNLQKETQIIVNRIQSEGGIVNDIDGLDNYIIFLKQNNALSKMLYVFAPNFGYLPGVTTNSAQKIYNIAINSLTNFDMLPVVSTDTIALLNADGQGLPAILQNIGSINRIPVLNGDLRLFYNQFGLSLGFTFVNPQVFTQPQVSKFFVLRRKNQQTQPAVDAINLQMLKSETVNENGIVRFKYNTIFNEEEIFQTSELIDILRPETVNSLTFTADNRSGRRASFYNSVLDVESFNFTRSVNRLIPAGAELEAFTSANVLTNVSNNSRFRTIVHFASVEPFSDNFTILHDNWWRDYYNTYQTPTQPPV